MMPIIKPAALQPGDAIGVVVPAGPVAPERIDRAIARVEARGFRTKTYGDVYRATGYLAGDAATRADELMAAFADPDTSAVWCARGGFGVVHLLDKLDFGVIRQSSKLFIGFSDISALHIAIHQHTGLVTFHGPNLQDGFGKPSDMPGANEAALWRLTRGDLTIPVTLGESEDGVSPIARFNTIRSGAATGRLIGGNLAVICGLVGTPFEIETAGRILFLEDVGERLYRIDRYLTQLRLAGKFDAVAGVLLGGFTYDEGDHAERQADVDALLAEFFRRFDVPVLAGFPAGHAEINLALPIGGLIRLDAGAPQVTLLESCVATR